MRNLLRVLILVSLILSITSCELLSPKEWAKFNRGQKLRGHTCDYDRKGNYKCYDKRPYCIRDSSGEIVECSEKPY